MTDTWPLTGVYINRGIAWSDTGEFENAIADWEIAIALSPKERLPYSKIAWLRATASDAAFRDAKLAIEYATRAGDLAEWKKDSCFVTLAAAHAEAGQFDEAKKRLQQAIDMSPKKDVEIRAKMMKLFHEGRPYREEPKAK